MRQQIQILIMTQLIVMSIYLALVYLLSWGDWFSGVTGCLASLLPTIYYSIRMMRQVDSYSAEQWLAYAYRSNVVKWMMMAMIFALAFTSSYQWDPVILFSGYLLMQVSGMFLPLIQKGN